MNYTNVTSPKWANAEQTTIECVVDFQGIGPVPFGASATDIYPHTVEIFNRCVAGDFGPVAEYVAPPPPLPVIPQSVSMRQARLALLAANLLDAVNAAMASMSQAAQIEWEYATEVRRDSQLVAGMGQVLNLDAEQLDHLFITAETL